MGKWNQRYLPQRKYRHESSHSYSETLSPDDWNSNVPSWEKQFCLTVGSVPWKKVLVAKKYMSCHNSVVRWNDSANEEAFTKAKNRFLADMDGLPCDMPPPDPDMYIHEIDWDPDIDPALTADLDKEYFNPDEAENFQTTLVEHKLSSSHNPWEGSYCKEASRKDVAQGWNDCICEDSNNNGNNNSNNKKNTNNNTIEWRNKISENPWEQSNIPVKGGAVIDTATTTTTKTTWLSSGDNSWGRKQKGALDEERRLWSNNFDSQCGWPNVGSAKNKGCYSSWNNNFKGHIKNDDMNRGQKRQQQDPPNIDRHRFDSSRRGGVSGFGEWRKREGSHQYSSRHKNPRFHGDESTGDCQRN